MESRAELFGQAQFMRGQAAQEIAYFMQVDDLGECDVEPAAASCRRMMFCIGSGRPNSCMLAVFPACRISSALLVIGRVVSHGSDVLPVLAVRRCQLPQQFRLASHALQLLVNVGGQVAFVGCGAADDERLQRAG